MPPSSASGSAIGSIFALIVFSAAAFSLPMMVDRKVDTVTAVVTSINAVLRNRFAMAVWAACIVVAVAPGFALLFIGRERGGWPRLDHGRARHHPAADRPRDLARIPGHDRCGAVAGAARLLRSRIADSRTVAAPPPPVNGFRSALLSVRVGDAGELSRKQMLYGKNRPEADLDVITTDHYLNSVSEYQTAPLVVPATRRE